MTLSTSWKLLQPLVLSADNFTAIICGHSNPHQLCLPGKGMSLLSHAQSIYIQVPARIDTFFFTGFFFPPLQAINIIKQNTLSILFLLPLHIPLSIQIDSLIHLEDICWVTSLSTRKEAKSLPSVSSVSPPLSSLPATCNMVAICPPI